MSYTTDIWIVNMGGPALDMFEIEDAYFAAAEGLNFHDLPGALFDAFCGMEENGGPHPMYNSYGEQIIQLSTVIAQLAPQYSFGLRGAGELFDDFWLIVFSGGNVHYTSTTAEAIPAL